MTWRENIPEGEAQRFEAYATELREQQRLRTKDRPHFRGLHTKPHVGVVGALEVPELPAELRVGPFAEPRTWPLYGRFSNGQPGFHKDSGPDIRGFALKLVGVPGKKIIEPLADAVTQDFLLIQTPATAVKDPDEFIALLRASRGGPLGLLPRMIKAVGFRRAFGILRAFLGSPKVRSLATGTYYTAAPLRFGDAACKVAAFPEQEDDRAAPKKKLSRDGFREDVIARLREGPLAWQLKVQLFVDETTTPIEDASVRWPEDKSPWRTVGRVVLPRQDVTSPNGQAVQSLVESMSFDPWHAVPELRPLGSMMRARAPAYRESVLERKAAPEPTGVLPPG